MAPPIDNATLLAKLEELVKKVDDTNQKADHTNQKLEEMQKSVQQIREEQEAVKVWKPDLENQLSKLRDTVSDLKLKVDLFIHESPKPEDTFADKSGVPASAHLGATARVEVLGQVGHHEAHPHRSVGVVTDLVTAPPPVKGRSFIGTTQSRMEEK
ncbi:unnamed protein product [Urochloa humidicola]